MRFAIYTAILFMPVLASAHHARVYFTDEVREIEGELVSVMWRNPHPEFTVRVTNSAGEQELWRLEGAGSLYRIQRAGLTGESFQIGQQVKALGEVSTRSETELLATNILLADGTEALLTQRAVPNWSDAQNAVGAEESSVYEVVDAEAEDLGFFRVWSPPGSNRGGSSSTPFTDAAISARSTWDPLNNFAMRCEQPGMPTAMRAPHPYELIDNGSEIILKGEAWDVERTVYLEVLVDNPTPSPLGYSVGNLDGSVLVVETTSINFPYFDTIGTPQSEDVRIIETFTLSGDQARLDYQLTIIDSATFTEPATHERYWLALGELLPVYDCQLNSQFQ